MRRCSISDIINLITVVVIPPGNELIWLLVNSKMLRWSQFSWINLTVIYLLFNIFRNSYLVTLTDQNQLLIEVSIFKTKHTNPQTYSNCELSLSYVDSSERFLLSKVLTSWVFSPIELELSLPSKSCQRWKVFSPINFLFEEHTP